MNDITKKLLEMISDISGEIKGAFNIREDGGCAGRQSTENVDIIPKVGQPGIDIIIKPNTHEKVYIPACVTKSNVDDLVYNDFYVGENADVVIVAGCGIFTDIKIRRRGGFPAQRHPPLFPVPERSGAL